MNNQNVSKQQNHNHYQKSKQEKRLYIGNLNKDLKEQDLIELFGFNTTTYLQENFVSNYRLEKARKIKALGLQ